MYNHEKYTNKYQQQYHNISIVYKMWIIKKFKYVMPFKINKLSAAQKNQTVPVCNYNLSVTGYNWIFQLL